ncbi:hypothetical protein [uncultured Marinobacter sp.]|uniref:hypothetical protein n=1 Tax=uncultured Marinobacter sp. TaxID=187379 RepID=UPI0025965F59|nr:hypothetical protein [uncultured Marinobacter sp.]
MSVDYKYTAVTGESWVRTKRIVIDNGLNELPVLKFVEERIVNIAGGEQYSRDIGTLEIPATESWMDHEIPILDPVTVEPTGGSITFGEAYNIVKSAYLHFANLRDNPPEAAPTEEPVAQDPTEGEAP